MVCYGGFGFDCGISTGHVVVVREDDGQLLLGWRGGRAKKRFEHYHDITSLTQSPGVHDGPLGNRISHGGHIDGFDGHGDRGGGDVVLRNRSMVAVVRCIVGIVVNDYIQFYLLSYYQSMRMYGREVDNLFTFLLRLWNDESAICHLSSSLTPIFCK